MMIPKRRLLTLIFACLCFKKSFLIKMLRFVALQAINKQIATFAFSSSSLFLFFYFLSTLMIANFLRFVFKEKRVRSVLDGFEAVHQQVSMLFKFTVVSCTQCCKRGTKLFAALIFKFTLSSIKNYTYAVLLDFLCWEVTPFCNIFIFFMYRFVVKCIVFINRITVVRQK